MFSWLKRARENRQIEDAVRFGPPYQSQVEELSELLQTDYTTKRIKPGHA